MKNNKNKFIKILCQIQNEYKKKIEIKFILYEI